MKEKIKNIFLIVTLSVLLIFGLTNCKCKCDYETVPVDKGVIENAFVESGTRVVMRYNFMLKRMMPMTVSSTDFWFVIDNDTILVNPRDYSQFSVGEHYIQQIKIQRVKRNCLFHKGSDNTNIIVE